ncbi:hypothetical protein N0V93_000445 [Gnomoniopsis smithogilvyi]|uniref:Uncharacterized protein n=1 Tax=Gnomoniopsis smithogilvyi TaxID=1191159 RepID=A0A9W8Z1L7_9PEZI|nr:hypothetical protein N0V93_000445 [Gnomoniopsis smithogilvyi]
MDDQQTLNCPTCKRQFDRLEHLKRHLATHTKEKNCVCGICGRKFSRIDALNRHHNVHRPHVPLRRFRACMPCAASRVKCSGTQPCERCEKRSLSCTFPEGSDHEARTLTGAGELSHDTQDAYQRNDELQPINISAQQPPLGPLQGRRTDTYNFMQPQAQQVDLTSNQINTHMISTLNWISPDMEFDLAADFSYNPMAPSNQYWDSPADVENLPNQPPQATQTVASIESLPQSTPRSFPESSDAGTPGTAYLDSRGFRQPRAGRYASRIFGEEMSRESPHQQSDLQRMTPEQEIFTFALLPIPILPSLSLEETDAIQGQEFNPEQYRTMCQAFQEFCLSSSNGTFQDTAFIASELPPLPTFTPLIALYRRHFDPKILPILHRQIQGESTSSWIVKLAMSAIGSQYFSAELSTVLHEFLRRVLRPYGAVFTNGALTMDSLGLVQAKLLNYIGLAYSGSRRLEKFRIPALQGLVGEYTSLHRIHSTVLRGETDFQDHQDWMLSESSRRLCHAIWLIDSMSRCHFRTQSSILLDFSEIALPCKEERWQAGIEQVQVPTNQPTLEKGLRVLYVEKRLIKGIGEFGQILIIFGLFCQTWEIAKSVSKPLLRWTPNAQKGNAESDELTSISWLPQIPLYNHWRNAACDGLDVLHWIANSTVADSGTENPTVLHLHAARLILLSPYQTIRDMADLLTSEDILRGDHAERFQKQCQEIYKWITDDQYKARLAMIHCGVLFWHIRRYSTDAFYEPTNVFLATLVVWAYGSFCSPQQLGISPRASENDRSRDDADWSSDVDDIPSSIRLDRPTDDELVQIFIKTGRSMSATINGVGNITAKTGPSRMLREGCKLLNTLEKWPIRRQYLQTLTRLADVCGRDRQWLHSRLDMRQTRQPASSV